MSSSRPRQATSSTTRPGVGIGPSTNAPSKRTVARPTRALRTALVGRATVRFDGAFVDGPMPTPGRVVELVACRGRLLDIVWDDGFVLHSRVRWGGAWHVYRDGEPW